MVLKKIFRGYFSDGKKSKFFVSTITFEPCNESMSSFFSLSSFAHKVCPQYKLFTCLVWTVLSAFAAAGNTNSEKGAFEVSNSSHKIIQTAITS
jgi:hypothetical protein